MIVGTMTAKSMINKARLANARSLTQKSVVNDLTSDLVAWYETSLESSFESGIAKKDGNLVSIWKDNNKDQTLKNDATMSTAANQPQFYNRAFYDSIPALRFDGAHYLNFNGSLLAKNSYTIFVVEQRSSTKSENVFIGGTGNNTNTNLILGYLSNTQICHAHYGNDLSPIPTVAGYNSKVATLHTFFFNNTVGKKYTLNGKSTTTNSAVQSGSLLSFNGAMIGRYNPDGTPRTYSGDIGEIIIFKRSLKTEEIEAIESYLGSKYGISVS